MTWLQRYKLRHYLQTSIWVLPAFGIVAALLSVRGFDRIEQMAGWQLESGANSVRDLLGTLAGSMFTFIVFLSSINQLPTRPASAFPAEDA